MKKFLIPAVLSLSLVFSFCTKEEEKDTSSVDLREQAVGEYNGSANISYYITEADTSFVEDVNFKVFKDKDNANTILINVDGGIIKGVKVAEAGNGFTFDIETQYGDLNDDGIEDAFVGENHFELEGTKYHGAFDSKTKKMLFTISSQVENDLDGDGILEDAKMVIAVSGTKK